MKMLSRDDVFSVLAKDPQSLNNDAFRALFEKSETFCAVSLETFDAFSKLVWHYSPYSKLLTKPHWWGGKLYTVGDVAKKMVENGWTFEALSRGEIAGDYKPGWFDSCQAIYSCFDWEVCLPLIVLNTTWSERWDCPASSFRIVDGIHRSLVIAYKVLSSELSYRPMTAIVLGSKMDGVKG